jgi:N utilization substance protein B
MNRRIHGRHGSRWVALQALYAWSLSHEPMAQIEEDLLAKNIVFTAEGEEPLKISFDQEYLHELVHAISERIDELNALLEPHLDRPISDVNPIEHAIILIGIYELYNHLETPYKVIINEAILLAKQFGAQDSHKFANGVLDKAAKVARARELEQLAVAL